MTRKTAAARYARALFDVAQKEHADLDRIEQELAQFTELMGAHVTLGKVLLNPAVPAPRKSAAVTELTSRAGVSTITGKLLVLLADRDRLVLLPDLQAAYRDRVLAYRNIVRAEVTEAAWISPRKALEGRDPGRSRDHRRRRGPYRQHGLRRQRDATAGEDEGASGGEPVRTRCVDPTSNTKDTKDTKDTKTVY